VIENLQAESALHNAVSCLVVVLVSLTLTGPLYYLPKATLASIIFLALTRYGKPDICGGDCHVSLPQRSSD